MGTNYYFIYRGELYKKLENKKDKRVVHFFNKYKEQVKFNKIDIKLQNLIIDKIEKLDGAKYISNFILCCPELINKISPETLNKNLSCWHIGKSSYGWVFSIHIDENLSSYKDLLKLFRKSGVIINEEMEIISKKEMIRIITKRKRKLSSTQCTKYYLSYNSSLDKKYGLFRDISCKQEYRGTYQYIPGEFS